MNIAIRVALGIVALSLLWSAAALAQNSRAEIEAEKVSLFQVPLQCPAAPQIACGSLAKAILMELERDPLIAEAWVNRAGSVLVVIGSERSSRASRAKMVRTLLLEIFEKEVATEIEGEARERALTSFDSGGGWYRGEQTDALSREEADIIGARLVRRIQSEVVLSAEKAKALETGFAQVFKDYFLRKPGASNQTRQTSGPGTQTQRNEQLLKVAGAHLDNAGVVVFQEAIAKGHRPLPGEK